MTDHRLLEISGILIFVIGSIIFVMGGLLTAMLIRPKRPNAEKSATYESGEEVQGNAWANFNTRFYIIALIFVLFEVEIVFLFPWATIFANEQLIENTGGLWGWFTLIEMFIFIFILALGLVYAWKKGFLDWVKPKTIDLDYKGKVPYSLYEKLNKKYSK